MEPQRRHDVKIGIRVMDPVKALEEIYAVHSDMLRPDREVEQNVSDHCDRPDWKVEDLKHSEARLLSPQGEPNQSRRYDDARQQ